MKTMTGFNRVYAFATYLFAAIILVASNVATGLIVKKNAQPKFDPARDMRTAIAKMADAKGPFAVIIGDSITQRASLPESVCGVTLINAGITGSRVSSFVPFAEEMASRGLAPAAIIVALGVTNAYSGYHTEFAASYSLLLDSLPAGSPVALATIAPVDLAVGEGKNIRPASIDAANLAILAAAKLRNLQSIRLDQLQNVGTVDGVHLSADGYPAWDDAIMTGFKTALNCDGIASVR
jgi:lysophospholipase L1-like esterase